MLQTVQTPGRVVGDSAFCDRCGTVIPPVDRRCVECASIIEAEIEFRRENDGPISRSAIWKTVRNKFRIEGEVTDNSSLLDRLRDSVPLHELRSQNERLSISLKEALIIGESVHVESAYSHSDDFSALRIEGREFALDVHQASVVRILWESAQAGSPNVDTHKLNAAIDDLICDNSHISTPLRWDSKFRSAPALRALIVKPVREDGKIIRGKCCLAFAEKLRIGA